MSNLIFTLLAAICLLCQKPLTSALRHGKVREGFCTGWSIDLLFSICGMLLSFSIFQYNLWPRLKWNFFILLILYLLLGILFLLLAPSGTGLFHPRPTLPEALLAAEYRFNDTLRMIRNFLLYLLLGAPLCLRFLFNVQQFEAFLFPLEETKLCGGICFICFLILFPISVRQSFFWFRHLRLPPDEAEMQLLQQYCNRLHYSRRNHLL
ncbi:MAG: hypothetical protein IJ335_11760 [Lachnospiraceae bacterium]|nr:hypothetical protein [Lachnospiraceae bacterium]